MKIPSCWCIMQVGEQPKIWNSDSGRQFWSTAASARRAFERDINFTKNTTIVLANSPDYELVEMADVRVNDYKQLLEQWLVSVEDAGVTTSNIELYKETRYALGLDPRPVVI